MLAILPGIIGFMGYLEINPTEYLDGLYFAIKIYLLDFSVDQRNILLEIARWTAPLVTTTVIIGTMGRMLLILKTYLTIIFTKNLVAIYGDANEINYLKADLIKQKIKYVELTKISSSKNIKNHIALFNSDEEALLFYSKSAHIVHEDSHIYLKLEQVSQHLLNNNKRDIYTFDTAELCAQNFNINNFNILEDLCPKDKVVKILLIGDAKRVERILYNALQINVFDQEQQIEYHVFSELNNFKSMHFLLEQKEFENRTEFVLPPKDKIIYHKGDWQESYINNSDMDQVIITSNSDVEALKIASTIRDYYGTSSVLYIDIKNHHIIRREIARANNIELFGNVRDLYSYNNIVNNDIAKSARHQHEYYQRKYEVADWNELDNFKRNSNIYSSMYWSLNRTKLEQEQPSRLARLEHIRWCRFHYLHNWSYGDKKCVVNRTHPLLLPFDDLDKESQLQNEETINNIKEIILKS